MWLFLIYRKSRCSDDVANAFVAGLFSDDHMDYEIDRDTSLEGEPSLSDMTRKAIQILQNNHNGFFLLVEGVYIYLLFKSDLNLADITSKYQTKKSNHNRLFSYHRRCVYL